MSVFRVTDNPCLQQILQLFALIAQKLAVPEGMWNPIRVTRIFLPLHRDGINQFSDWSIYYSAYSEFNGRKIGKSYLCVLTDEVYLIEITIETPIAYLEIVPLRTQRLK